MMAIALTVGTTACSPDSFAEPNEAGIPSVSIYENDIDISVDQNTNYVTFTFNGSGVIPVWVIDGSTYSTNFSFQKYYRKAGDYTIDFKVMNANGMSDGTITRTFHIDKTIMNGFGGFDYDSDYNLWKKATIGTLTYWYAPGWSQIADPSVVAGNGSYVVSLPEATTDTWQAQMFIPTDISTSSANTYDFSIILTSTTDHPHVMIKLVGSDDNVFYCAETVALTANEPYCFWKSDMPGLDIDALRLVLDFGGNEANTTVTVENIVLKDHANDDGTVVPETPQVAEPSWAGVDSADNLWSTANVSEFFYYYAPGWAQIADPATTVSADGHEITLVMPDATWDQWQAQFHILNTGVALSASETYDFRVTIASTQAVGNTTIKLAQNDDDGIYLFSESVSLAEGDETVFKAIEVAGADISNAKLVFDFGGNPANTTVTIKNVILQVHKY
jgi:hypothetical protein